jgi:hypothetical protein
MKIYKFSTKSIKMKKNNETKNLTWKNYLEERLKPTVAIKT